MAAANENKLLILQRIPALFYNYLHLLNILFKPVRNNLLHA